MNLTSQIKDNLKKEIKQGNSLEVSVLRMSSAALHNAKIAKGGELNEEEELEVLSREAKKRRESIEAYEKAGREELADKERKELKILEEYLPDQLSREELENIVRETIDEVGAKSKSDMGRVMGAVMAKVKGRADGSKVKDVVLNALEG